MSGDKPFQRGDWADLVGAHLDVVLVPRGFQLAREGPQDVVESPMAHYWAYPDEFARRYPPIGSHYAGDVTDVCLWVGVSESGNVTCCLEGPTLEEWLREYGMVEQLEGWEEQPRKALEAQLSALATILGEFLDAVAGPAGPAES